ncbi:MAG: permease [Eubacteriaceae bacterium]|nr:permease [Eubacteriaceae bacterium]
MNSIFSYYLYGIAAILLIISYLKNKNKTLLGLKKALKMFLNVLPQFIAILFLLGLLLAAIPSSVIKNVLGENSGISGILASAALGSITIIPVIIAFPIASELLQSGAGIVQIAVFISTLTTVGFATMPLEIKYLGKKTTYLRNLFALIFSFITAYVTGWALR